MMYRVAKVTTPGPIQDSGISSHSLVVGEGGIEKLEGLPDGRIRVHGKRGNYVLWPANIAWAEEVEGSDLPSAKTASDDYDPIRKAAKLVAARSKKA